MRGGGDCTSVAPVQETVSHELGQERVAVNVESRVNAEISKHITSIPPEVTGPMKCGGAGRTEGLT